MRLALAFAILCAAAASCYTAPSPSTCGSDSDCPGGMCWPSPAGRDTCAYPDGECLTGWRWEDVHQLSHSCVDSTDLPSADAGVDALPTCQPLIAFTRADGLYVIRPDGSGITSIASGGQEANPVWSPDGKRILIERTANGAKDIFLVNVDGTGLANLTNATGDDMSAAWSPDGTMIAFTSERNYSGSGSDVFIMEADGRNPRLVDIKADSSSWEPNGAHIAYASYKSGRFQVYTANPDGTGSTNITNSGSSDGGPRWSPDGSRIAFEGLRGGLGTSIYVMNSDGTNQRALVPGLQVNGYPVWSPDGQGVAFNGAVNIDSESDVYRVNVDGAGLVNLTAGSATEDRDPSWSPDGSQLAIVSKRDGNDEIYRINNDATGPLRVTVTDFFSENGATWSPCRAPQ